MRGTTRVRVLLAAIAALALMPATAVRADDAVEPPQLTVGDVIVTEGDAGAAIITVPVDLSRPTNAIVTVRYTVTSGSPDTNSGDFVARSGKLTFRIGVTASKVNVTLWGDTNLEGGNENVQVNLSAPMNAELLDPEGHIFIADDDDGAPSEAGAISIGQTVVTESDAGTHYVYVPLMLAAPAAAVVRVEVLGACSTPAITAPAKQTISFQAGQRVKTLKYRVAADLSPGSSKHAFRSIRLKTGSGVVTVPKGQITIEENDGEDAVLGESARVNVSSSGEQAAYPAPTGCGVHGFSYPQSISEDGRFVVFGSDAMNLVGDDTNGTFDVFLRDRSAHTTERISVTNDGGELSQGGGAGFVSDDGTKVAFISSSPELDGGTNTFGTFVRDRTEGTTERVGILPDGSIPPGAGACGISGDGRFVGFLSSTGSQTVNLYIRDLQTSTTQFVVGSATGWGICPFTRDGSQIAFTSTLSNLVPGDTNDHADVFVANVGAGTFERINMSPSGQQEARPDPTRPDINASRIAMSRDGRFVTFWSTSANMVPPNHSSVFLRDRATQTTQEVSVGYPTGPDWQICFSQNEGVSNDGRYVSFSVLCEKADGAGRPTDLVGTFMRDRVAGVTTRVDELPDGTPANGFSSNSFMSADGRYVTYMSYASNLVPDDTNRFPDLFIRRVS